ncbi:MAG: hypothetical protein JRH07_09120 [Deltaproteobacteria bacterium]|nr:hypothetical protein [Deltaproteobacteria bacterium]MBW2121992.1 hypothetical protein [Deltaproteobacteria bacterium]
MKQKFLEMIDLNGLGSERIRITATPLTPEEAIGNPEDRDYPLLKGKERIMEAEFRGARGHAFTDMYGDFSGTLVEVAEMALKNNFRRAIFISSLNALMRYIGKADRTVHCKDQSPPRCARELVSYIEKRFGRGARIAMAGFQPRMVEALSGRFDVRVTDMDPDNTGKTRFGLLVRGPDQTAENLSWADICLVTGTTVTNGTIVDFLIEKPTIFYGVTIAGAAVLLKLRRFCPLAE